MAKAEYNGNPPGRPPIWQHVPLSLSGLEAVTNLKAAFRNHPDRLFRPREINREVARHEQPCPCPACGKKASVEHASIWRPGFTGEATFIRCMSGCPVVREERASA